ncbi:MAG: hypothetical protein R3Y29_03320 [bacterium]
MNNNNNNNNNFKYSIKVLKNSRGIKKVKICKYCKTINDVSYMSSKNARLFKRCIVCKCKL